MARNVVGVRSNEGGGNCLYYALSQALRVRDTHQTVAQLREALAVYLAANLEAAVGMHGSFADAVWDAVRTGCSANSVDAYVHQLRVGTDVRGETPYGGALEIELFVRVWEGYCVNVWAAPGDVLARGRNEYRLVAVYGDGSQVVDLRLSNSGTWAAHYELIHPQVHMRWLLRWFVL